MSSQIPGPPLFQYGRILFTPGSIDFFGKHGTELINALVFRHLRGDWGDVSEADAKENDFSVKNGFRIMSVYTIDGDTIWIITEADRSATTFLKPGEY